MTINKMSIGWFIFLVLSTVVLGELFARYFVGLGTPPLLIAHPKIEYMFRPNQNVYRFGNHIAINQYGMRADPFSITKSKGEFRIMLFGDSVLNGGNLTGHSELASTIVQSKLKETNEKITVGNISAGSWGPGNWHEYAKEFGFFGTDIVILIISSHDYVDNPTFQKLNSQTHPTENPKSALLEGITRYLPRYIPQLGESIAIDELNHSDKYSGQASMEGLKQLKDFLELAKSVTDNVMVLQHWEKTEIENGFAKTGNQRIKDICLSIGIKPISLKAIFQKSLENGLSPYRDNIHPNSQGQQLIAKTILEAVVAD